jgi:hypothetical protein
MLTSITLNFSKGNLTKTLFYELAKTVTFISLNYIHSFRFRTANHGPPTLSPSSVGQNADQVHTPHAFGLCGLHRCDMQT